MRRPDLEARTAAQELAKKPAVESSLVTIEARVEQLNNKAKNLTDRADHVFELPGISSDLRRKKLREQASLARLMTRASYLVTLLGGLSLPFSLSHLASRHESDHVTTSDPAPPAPPTLPTDPPLSPTLDPFISPQETTPLATEAEVITVPISPQSNSEWEAYQHEINESLQRSDEMGVAMGESVAQIFLSSAESTRMEQPEQVSAWIDGHIDELCDSENCNSRVAHNTAHHLLQEHATRLSQSNPTLAYVIAEGASRSSALGTRSQRRGIDIALEMRNPALVSRALHDELREFAQYEDLESRGDYLNNLLATQERFDRLPDIVRGLNREDASLIREMTDARVEEARRELTLVRHRAQANQESEWIDEINDRVRGLEDQLHHIEAIQEQVDRN